jgi:hypothetical protein
MLLSVTFVKISRERGHRLGVEDLQFGSNVLSRKVFHLSSYVLLSPTQLQLPVGCLQLKSQVLEYMYSVHMLHIILPCYIYSIVISNRGHVPRTMREDSGLSNSYE